MCVWGDGGVGLGRNRFSPSSLLDRAYFTGKFRLFKALFFECHLLHGDHPFLITTSRPSSTRPLPLLFGVESCSFS